MDIDMAEYCDECRQPLLLVEETSKNGDWWKKATSNLRAFANRMNVPAILVVTDDALPDDLLFGVKHVAPTATRDFEWLTEYEMGQLLTSYHRPCPDCGHDATQVAA